MNHLDALEAESIYILREAFAKLDKLAILWSLGKDSNVVLWLVRKAFFGHVPFPVMHVDTEMKFPEMYAFRDRYAKEWNLNFIRELCPPMEATDPTLPPAARSAARKTLGLKDAVAKHGFNGLILGIRRDEEAIRAKERYFSPRGEDSSWNLKDQPPEFWDQYMTSFPEGTHVRVHPLLHWTEVDIWKLHQAREHPGHRSLFRQERQALPLARRPGHHLADRERRRHARRDHHRARDHPRARALRAGPWTTSPRTRSSGCAPPATCEAGHAAMTQHDPRDPPAQDRHRRPRRSRQVDPGRPADPRDRLPARRQARGDQGHVRAARHAVRVGVPDGRDPGRARPGHHDRHHADLVPHRASGPTSSSTRRATRSSSRTWSPAPPPPRRRCC